jgi:protein TonB
MSNNPLTIRPQGEGHDVRGMFADQPTGRTRFISGTAVHVAFLLLLVAAVSLIPDEVYQAVLPDRLPKDIVWIAQPGPGGGGGGSPKPDPPKPVEVQKPEPAKVAVIKPEPVPVPIPVFEPQILPSLDALVPTDVSSLSAIAPPTTQDSGGRGKGTGAGPGTGPGLGPGLGGGTGGDVYQPGNGVTSPIPVRQVKPAYTADAMRARAQGVVDLDCVVMPTGQVGSCDIVRTMKPPFGLDGEALKAARQWQFRPGTRFGEPVAVLVRIELEFNLR